MKQTAKPDSRTLTKLNLAILIFEKLTFKYEKMMTQFGLKRTKQANYLLASLCKDQSQTTCPGIKLIPKIIISKPTNKF